MILQVGRGDTEGSRHVAYAPLEFSYEKSWISKAFYEFLKAYSF